MMVSVHTPVLNIMDAIWVSQGALDGLSGLGHAPGQHDRRQPGPRGSRLSGPPSTSSIPSTTTTGTIRIYAGHRCLADRRPGHDHGPGRLRPDEPGHPRHERRPRRNRRWSSTKRPRAPEPSFIRPPSFVRIGGPEALARHESPGHGGQRFHRTAAWRRRSPERGHDVACLVRRTSDTRPLERLPLRLVVGDLGDPSSLAAAVADRDHVFHLAGIVQAARRTGFRIGQCRRDAPPRRSLPPRPRRTSSASSSSPASPRPGPSGPDRPVTEDRRAPSRLGLRPQQAGRRARRPRGPGAPAGDDRPAAERARARLQGARAGHRPAPETDRARDRRRAAADEPHRRRRPRRGPDPRRRDVPGAWARPISSPTAGPTPGPRSRRPSAEELGDPGPPRSACLSASRSWRRAGRGGFAAVGRRPRPDPGDRPRRSRSFLDL